MAKGEYEFPILVTCLLILALQIHNPFLRPPQSGCRCDGAPAQALGRPADATAPSAGNAGVERPSAATPAAGGGAGAPYSPAPPVYRKPREVGAQAQGAGAGGLSTEELLKELNSIQAKAKEQQDALAAAGKMPPPSPLLQQLKEVEAMEGSGADSYGQGHSGASSYAGAGFVGGGGAAAGLGAENSRVAGGAGGVGAGSGVRGAAGLGVGAAGGLSQAGGGDSPMLRRRLDFGRFLEARQPRGLGVVLGVGRGDFAMRLLGDWASAQGLYLVDPFIYQWRGYNDPANLPDRDQQLIFEDLRNRLAPYDGRFVLVRDFSHSFAEGYHSSGQAAGQPTFVYVDANHAEQAVSRDLELWWALLARGGLLAGSTYTDDDTGNIRVRTAVDRFASRQRLQVYLTHDDSPPSWFVFKP